jgi:hypothetical protein
MKAFCSLLIAGLALCGPLLRGAPPREDDLPRVRADGRRLMFGWHGGSPHRVDVSSLIRAVTLSTADVLDAERMGDVDYILVSVSGPSGAANGGIANVMGTETNLLWLKLKSWKLLDAQSMLYQSFYDSLEPIGEYHKIGGILTIRFTNKLESSDYVLRYDCSHPDAKVSMVRVSDFE